MFFVVAILCQPASAQGCQEGLAVDVSVWGEHTLSGVRYVDDKGQIALPIVGSVRVCGRSAEDIERTIAARLADGYLKNPVVTVKLPDAVASSESQGMQGIGVYVLGEVKTPGYYKLPEGAGHVLHVVALAGGYTARADEASFEIIRVRDGKYYRKKAQVGALRYHDGDILIIGPYGDGAAKTASVR